MYIINMYACDVFTDYKMEKWENGDPMAQGWVATTAYFDQLWTNRITFSSREEGVRPFESAATIVDARAFTLTESLNTLECLNRLEAENATLKEEIMGGTVATTTPIAPTTTAPLAEIIADATTSNCDNALVAALQQQNTAQTEMMTKLMAILGGNIRVRRRQCRDGAQCGDRGDEAPAPRVLHLCNILNKNVMLEPADCWELESNAAKRPAAWPFK